MARTLAQLSGAADLLSDRLDVTRGQVDDLWKSRDATRDELAEIRRENALLRQENAALRKEFDAERTLGRARDEANAALRQELALVRQQFADHLKHNDTWANRAWGFFVVLVAAVLSLASGLIVALVRK